MPDLNYSQKLNPYCYSPDDENESSTTQISSSQSTLKYPACNKLEPLDIDFDIEFENSLKENENVKFEPFKMKKQVKCIENEYDMKAYLREHVLILFFDILNMHENQKINIYSSGLCGRPDFSIQQENLTFVLEMKLDKTFQTSNHQNLYIFNNQKYFNDSTF